MLKAYQEQNVVFNTLEEMWMNKKGFLMSPYP